MDHKTLKSTVEDASLLHALNASSDPTPTVNKAQAMTLAVAYHDYCSAIGQMDPVSLNLAAANISRIQAETGLELVPQTTLAAVRAYFAKKG
jgi:hypothetical protein